MVLSLSLTLLPSRYCVELPWTSRSMTNVRLPSTALMAAKLHVIVDLPTPPFWLKMTLRMLSPLNQIVESRIIRLGPVISNTDKSFTMALRTFRDFAGCFKSNFLAAVVADKRSRHGNVAAVIGVCFCQFFQFCQFKAGFIGNA